MRTRLILIAIICAASVTAIALAASASNGRGSLPRTDTIQVSQPSDSTRMRSDPSHEISDLQRTVKVLTERVDHLERAMSALSVGPARAAAFVLPIAKHGRRRRPRHRPTRRRPSRRSPRRRDRPHPRLLRHLRSTGASSPSDSSPARTLAWAGGIATVLGIELLFVMAASRGWISPSMRVGIGVLVSLGLVAAAVEFDRRSWRSDAILAAAGAGTAGLYACLWAATSLYHLVSSEASAPLAAVIAGTAVAVALRIGRSRWPSSACPPRCSRHRP